MNPLPVDVFRCLSAFFPLYYLRRYTDIAAALGKDNELAAARHYRSHGIKEMRSPNPFFDPLHYRKHPDLRTLGGPQLLQHWIDKGIRERRRGCEYFDLGFYTQNPSDLQSIAGTEIQSVFEHWLTVGNSQARFTAKGKYVQAILRLGLRQEDGVVNIVAASGIEDGCSPELFKPFNTLAGQFDFDSGWAFAPAEPPPDGASGADIGGLIGQGIERTLSHIEKEVTGPAWCDSEPGAVGDVLGQMAKANGAADLFLTFSSYADGVYGF